MQARRVKECRPGTDVCSVAKVLAICGELAAPPNLAGGAIMKCFGTLGGVDEPARHGGSRAVCDRVAVAEVNDLTQNAASAPFIRAIPPALTSVALSHRPGLSKGRHTPAS
jgi:hypothetical protein